MDDVPFMAKFRKKPVEIDAWQFLPEEKRQQQPQWFISAVFNGVVWYQGGERPYYSIRTLEGEMRAYEGDYIICGVRGELYPCKADIFAQTYEPVEE